MKNLVALTSALAFLAGCSVLSKVPGVPSTGSVLSTSAGATDNAVNNSSGSTASSSDSKSDSPVALGDSRPTVASELPGTEAKLAQLIGASDSRYSASTVQGSGSPICQVGEGNTALSIWNFDLKANASREGNLDCFVMNDQKAFSRPSKFQSFRDFDDRHMFSKPAAVVVTKKGAMFANVQNGIFWAAEFGDTIRMLEFPTCNKAKEGNINPDLAIRYLDTFCDMKDLSKAKFDVLTKDVDSAKKVKLADEKKAFFEKALATAKQRGDEITKAELDALEKVKFPASAGGDDNAIKVVKEYIATHKVDIDPASIKKVVVSSPWNTTKSPIGIIMHRTRDVTVGFARTDAYSIAPTKKCAFVTFEVKENHDGAKFEAPQATGAATGWTNIKCESLK